MRGPDFDGELNQVKSWDLSSGKHGKKAKKTNVLLFLRKHKNEGKSRIERRERGGRTVKKEERGRIKVGGVLAEG